MLKRERENAFALLAVGVLYEIWPHMHRCLNL